MQLSAEELVLVATEPIPPLLFVDVADDEEDEDAPVEVDDVDDDVDDEDDDDEEFEEDEDDVDGPFVLLPFVLNAFDEEFVEPDDELEPPPVAAATLGPPLPDGAAPTVGKF